MPSFATHHRVNELSQRRTLNGGRIKAPMLLRARLQIGSQALCQLIREIPDRFLGDGDAVVIPIGPYNKLPAVLREESVAPDVIHLEIALGVGAGCKPDNVMAIDAEKGSFHGSTSLPVDGERLEGRGSRYASVRCTNCRSPRRSRTSAGSQRSCSPRRSPPATRSAVTLEPSGGVAQVTGRPVLAGRT